MRSDRPTRNPPPPADPFVSASDALHAGRLDEAERLLKLHLAIRPNDPHGHNALGSTYLVQCRPHQAAECFQRAINLAPRLPEPHFNLGVAFYDLGQLDRAARAFRAALDRDPRYLKAAKNLAATLVKLGHYLEAESIYERAVTLDAKNLDIAFGLADLYENTNRITKALALLEAAQTHHKNDARLHQELGYFLHKLKRLDAAEAHFKAAIASDPDYAYSHYSLALINLEIGRYAEAWPRHEWRWKTGIVAKPPDEGPLWTGEPLRSDQPLLVQSEQGAGTMIQFARFLHDVPGAPARIFETFPSLVRLFQHSFATTTIIPRGTAIPLYCCRLPLVTLPLILRTTSETVPAKFPYLAAPPAVVQFWAQEIRPTSRAKVGLVWAGSPANRNDRERSIPLELLSPMLDIPGVAWFSLQVGPPAKALERIGHVMDLSPLLTDYAETAGAIENLDLIITVETSVAHLSLALNRPTWVLLPFAADWRWSSIHGRNPWYPHAVTFRQAEYGEWSPVIARVRGALEEFVASFRPRER